MRGFKLVVYILLGLVAFLVSEELVWFVGKSPEAAATFARQAFDRECQKRNLNPNDFIGPQLSGSVDTGYNFIWRGRSKDAVLVSVFYLPRYSVTQYSPPPT